MPSSSYLKITTVYLHIIKRKKTKGTEDLSQWLRVLADLQRTQINPSLHLCQVAQMVVTPVPEVLASGFRGQFSRTKRDLGPL